MHEISVSIASASSKRFSEHVHMRRLVKALFMNSVEYYILWPWICLQGHPSIQNLWPQANTVSNMNILHRNSIWSQTAWIIKIWHWNLTQMSYWQSLHKKRKHLCQNTSGACITRGQTDLKIIWHWPLTPMPWQWSITTRVNLGQDMAKCTLWL